MSIESGSDSGRARYPALAAALRARRDELGLTRKDLTAATGLSYPYVAQLEGGYRAPSLATARKLADALRLDVERIVELAADTESETPRGPAGQSFANPAYLGAPRELLASASMGDAFAPDALSAPPPAAPAARRNFLARRSRGRGTDAAVADAAALLTALPADERLAALAALQQQVVDSVVADRSEPPSST